MNDWRLSISGVLSATSIVAIAAAAMKWAIEVRSEVYIVVTTLLTIIIACGAVAYCIRGRNAIVTGAIAGTIVGIIAGLVISPEQLTRIIDFLAEL